MCECSLLGGVVGHVVAQGGSHRLDGHGQGLVVDEHALGDPMPGEPLTLVAGKPRGQLSHPSCTGYMQQENGGRHPLENRSSTGATAFGVGYVPLARERVPFGTQTPSGYV
jgi:hypothetical protein